MILKRRYVVEFALFAITLATILSARSANAADYYVATTTNGGNNSNAGTSSSPWALVSYAVTKVASGDTIHVGAGTFTESTNFALPSGVSLIGAGISQTTIKGQSQGEIFTTSNGSNVTISDLTFDGNSQAIDVGCYINAIDHLSIERVGFQNFNRSAMFLYAATNSDLGYCTFSNCSYNGSNGNFGSAALYVGKISNTNVHDLTVNTADYRGGKGITTTNINWVGNQTDPVTMDNDQFYNNNIKVQSTDNGESEICIELFRSDCQNVEIHNNTFNNSISLVSAVSPSRTNAIRVDNNQWLNNPGYGIEVEYDNLTIDHNYFQSGGYAMAYFSSTTHSNHVVHHNVFANSGFPTIVGHYASGLTNLSFYNNTVVNGANYQLFYFGKSTTGDVAENNIFAPTVATSTFANGTTFSADHNLFYNISPVGTNAISANPNFVGSGAAPSPFWTLASNSPAINAGLVISGITDGYVGSAPDLGAYEYGSSSTGSAPAAPTLSGTAGNGSVSLSWNAPTGATSYQVKYGTSTGNYTTTLASQSGTTANISSLTNGAKYYFVVTASNSYGTSGNSNELPLTPSSTTTGGGSGSYSGSLSGSTSTAYAPNLTAEGTTDWAHWGGTGSGSAPGMDHKSSGGGKISAYTQVGGVSPTAYTNDGGKVSWTDGTVTASSTNNPNGVYVTGVGNGFSFTAPADTASRTLRVYVGGYLSVGTLTAHLSDDTGKTKDYTITAGGTTIGYDATFVITYQAASSNQTLTVTWKMSTDGGGGLVSMRAATLQGGAAATAVAPSFDVASGSYSTAQHVHLSSPTPGAVIHYTTDGSTPSASSPTYTTEVYVASSETVNAITVATGYANSAPSSATYTIGATLTGKLSGSVAASPTSDNLTTEGTTDWAHWGDGNAPGMNHKSSGGSKISAYSVVGSGTANYFTNSPVNYSWTDGSPTVSQAGTHNGVYVAAVNNGFSFTAPADTTNRTLKVYVGAANANGKMTAHLSDGSAADYVDTSLNDTGNVGGGTAKCYTFTYNAQSAGQTLKITWIVGTDHGGGNINLQAASLH